MNWLVSGKGSKDSGSISGSPSLMSSGMNSSSLRMIGILPWDFCKGLCVVGSG